MLSFLLGRNHWHAAIKLRIAQGVDMGRPGLLEATAEKRNGRITGMWIGGKCAAMMRGSLEL
jgi:trans-2,3-dihydro-3-hydroxyanthranilate isomerase